jgi:hypothetical protein
VHDWTRAATAAVVTWSLVMVGLFAWLWFGLSAWYTSFEREVRYLGWLLVLGFASKIILFVKVKVLGGCLCAYGWVTMLLYCLW